MDRKIPIANIYYLLCYAWSHVEERDVVRLEELDGLERVTPISWARCWQRGPFG